MKTGSQVHEQIVDVELPIQCERIFYLDIAEDKTTEETSGTY